MEIMGPKWCGKTWTALSRSRSVDRLDDAAAFDAATNAPSLVLMGEEPHLVDEWKDVPQVWDATRRHVETTRIARATDPHRFRSPEGQRLDPSQRHGAHRPSAHVAHEPVRIRAIHRRIRTKPKPIS